MPNSFLCTGSVNMNLFETLFYWTVVTFQLAFQCLSLRHFQFCANDREKYLECPTGMVISIAEDSIRLCYKEQCGAIEDSTHRQSEMTLLERCHGKGECTLYENDIVQFMCSFEANALDFTYNCINLYTSHGINLILGALIDENIGANEEIQVRSHNSLQLANRNKPMTYTCEFTNIEKMQESELFLRFQQVLLAKKSILQIEVDSKRYLSLIRKGDKNFVGQDNCKALAFKDTVVVHYRTCAAPDEDETIQGSMWITMRTNTPLHVKCYTNRTTTRMCSSEYNADSCISKKTDIFSSKDLICNCPYDAYPASGSAAGTVMTILIIVALIIVVTVCVLVYFFILKPRQKGKQEPQKDTVYSDTAFSLASTEPQEINHYTDFDLRPSPNHTDIEQSASGRYTDIDLPDTVLVRNGQDSSTASVPNVQYGKVNKPKKNRAGNSEGSKMLNDNNNVVDCLTEAEDEPVIMVMQENTDLHW